VSGLAPLLTQRETVDREVDGVQQRSYLVMFNDKGPYFGMNKEKLQSWLEVNFAGVEPQNVDHIYEITKNFRGYAVWVPTNGASLQAIREHEGTDYVEEASVVRTTAPFTVRPDWGQVRGTTAARALDTVPSGLYNSQYPNAGSDTDSWNWTAGTYGNYRFNNNGFRAKIWVVDTGVLTAHQEFVVGGNSRVTPAVNMINDGRNGQDCNGHGTHCAGSAGGNFRGIATGASLASVRVLSCAGSGSNADVIAGFNYVSSNQVRSGNIHSNIMSVSLGGGFSQTSNNAVANAITNGVIAVIAAGNNNGADACNYSPASTPTAITVMASDRTDARASFTNVGTCTTIFAPGVSIHSGWYTSNTAYNTISGTSMATPLTAGGAAVLASTYTSGPTPATIKTALVNAGSRNFITNVPSNTPNVLLRTA